MSEMSDLSLLIHEFTGGDKPRTEKLENEIHDYWNGEMGWSDLSDEAQVIFEQFETGQTEYHGPNDNRAIRELNMNEEEIINFEEENYGKTEGSLLK
jgi:hypothetical protein